MKIANNVEMLEIAMPQGGKMHPVLAWDDKDVVLFDTGLPGQMELISAAVEKAGFTLNQITKVLLTHHDMDHIGTAKQLAKHGAKILAHEKEAPYVQGDLPSPKLSKMQERMKNLSPEERLFYDRIQSSLPDLYLPVDEILHDDEELPFCGGIKVVFTPGHTPGHTAYFLKKSKVLITGDAANISNGELTGPNARNTLDMQKGEESFEKLKKMDADFVVCYHSGLYSKR